MLIVMIGKSNLRVLLLLLLVRVMTMTAIDAPEASIIVICGPIVKISGCCGGFSGAGGSSIFTAAPSIM